MTVDGRCETYAWFETRQLQMQMQLQLQSSRPTAAVDDRRGCAMLSIKLNGRLA